MSPALNFPLISSEPLFVGKDLCLESADGSQIVCRDLPSGKVRSAGFFQDHKKVFIYLNTLSEGRIFFNKRGINTLILCLHCLGFHSLAAFEDPVDCVQQLGRVDRF